MSGVTRWPETWLMRRGEIWWVEFDPSVGSEIRKTRPAIIVSNDSANRNLARVVVVPLTGGVIKSAGMLENTEVKLLFFDINKPIWSLDLIKRH